MKTTLMWAVAAALTSVVQGAAADVCSLSIVANHHHLAFAPGGGPPPYVSVDLARSEYRSDDRSWRSVRDLCRVDRIELALGETAALSCRTDLECGAYQFLLRIKSHDEHGRIVGSRLVALPAGEDAVRLERLRPLNLGNLNELFGAPRTPEGPSRRSRARL